MFHSLYRTKKIKSWLHTFCRFTTKYVSPALQQAELQSINKSNTTIWNLEVHVYTGALEVAVVYKVDEFNIELILCACRTAIPFYQRRKKGEGGCSTVEKMDATAHHFCD